MSSEKLSIVKHNEFSSPNIQIGVSGFEIQSWNQQYWLCSREVNKNLALTPLFLDLAGKYSIPDDLGWLQDLAIKTAKEEGKSVFDSDKVRLNREPDFEKRQASVSKTSYFAGLATNELSQSRVLNSSGEAILDCFDLSFPENTAPSLEDSICSNHIGVSTLGITNDGYLPIITTSSNSAQYADKRAPSGSGSLDWADCQSSETLQQAVIVGLERELSEECGLSSDIELHTELTGYARYLNRGAKPEFFALTKIDAQSKDIKQEVADKYSARLDLLRLDGSMPPAKSLLAIRNQLGKAMSLSLYLCFTMAAYSLASATRR